MHSAHYKVWTMNNIKLWINTKHCQDDVSVGNGKPLTIIDSSKSKILVSLQDVFQYPSNTIRNVFKPTQISPSLGYINKMIVVWWLVAGQGS